MKRIKGNVFHGQTIDKGKLERYIFDFRRIEELAGYLQRKQKSIESRQFEWNAKLEQLWGEINRLKVNLGA